MQPAERVCGSGWDAGAPRERHGPVERACGSGTVPRNERAGAARFHFFLLYQYCLALFKQRYCGSNVRNRLLNSVETVQNSIETVSNRAICICMCSLAAGSRVAGLRDRAVPRGRSAGPTRYHASVLRNHRSRGTVVRDRLRIRYICVNFRHIDI